MAMRGYNAGNLMTLEGKISTAEDAIRGQIYTKFNGTISRLKEIWYEQVVVDYFTAISEDYNKMLTKVYGIFDDTLRILNAVGQRHTEISKDNIFNSTDIHGYADQIDFSGFSATDQNGGIGLVDPEDYAATAIENLASIPEACQDALDKITTYLNSNDILLNEASQNAVLNLISNVKNIINTGIVACCDHIRTSLENQRTNLENLTEADNNINK